MTAAGAGNRPAPRRGIFELDGRAAPGLYAAGWGLLVVGVASLVIGLAAAGSSGAAAIFFVGGLGIVGVAFVAAAGAQGLQRAADGAAYAGPSPFLVFGAALVLALVASFGLTFVFRLVGFVPGGQLALVLTVLTDAFVAVGCIRLLVVGPGALTWAEMGFRRPRPGEGSMGQDIGWGMALAIPAFAAGYLVAAILGVLLGAVPESPIPLTRDPSGVLLDLVAAAAIAPFWEETFFRGFATTAWARAIGDRPAIIRGAVFFAAIHVLGVTGVDFTSAVRVALIAFAVRLPVGLFLGWALLRRRTLVAPMALHATYNTVPILVFALLGAVAGG